VDIIQVAHSKEYHRQWPDLPHGLLADLQYVDAAGYRNERAWHDVYGRYNPVIRRALAWQRLDRRWQDDLVQAIWYRAMMHIQEARSEAEFPGWLRRIADHTFKNHVKAERGWDRRQAIAANEAIDRDARRREIEDARGDLVVLLSSLPSRDRVFLERWVAGWTHDELAQAEGYASRAVSEQRLHRIKKRLDGMARRAR
jgi:RNA polymerase sigma factor (sigma-70 family)